MAYKDLHNFIEKLEQDGDLIRVKTPVSTHLEMTEIQTRVIRDKGPAILFENVIKPDGTKSSIPVLVNLFGTTNRVAKGIKRNPSELRQVGEELAMLAFEKIYPALWSRAREDGQTSAV